MSHIMRQDHHDCGDETVARVVHLTRVQNGWPAETAAAVRLTECKYLRCCSAATSGQG
jgi:hypothetical protein